MEAEAFALVSGAIVVTSNELRPVLVEVLTSVMDAAGKATARTVPTQTEVSALRALAPKIGFKFDVTNPRAVEWIEEHAGEAIDGINESTREAIRDVIEAAFTEQFDVDELTDRIEELIGDADRADNIARTETMTASNQGQLEAWDQATDAGLLNGDEKKEWIVTPDDRLCPICEPLDGQQVEMSGVFKTELGDVDAPPVHPRCRCTIGLVAGA